VDEVVRLRVFMFFLTRTSSANDNNRGAGVKFGCGGCGAKQIGRFNSSIGIDEFAERFVWGSNVIVSAIWYLVVNQLINNLSGKILIYQ